MFMLLYTAIRILEANNIIFAKVFSALHFDQDQTHDTWIFEAMFVTRGNNFMVLLGLVRFVKENSTHEQQRNSEGGPEGRLWLR